MALVLRLAAGIMAIQSPGAPVSPEQAMQYATAAAYHAQQANLDPWEIIGIARNESDFRVDLVGPDGLDCGIAQTRVVYSKYKCKELRKDPWIGFAEAARELKENQARCLKRNPHDLKRCRINSYNQGVKYAKSGHRGAYWLRVTCFAEAAKTGLPLRNKNCRKVKSRGDIARLIKQLPGGGKTVAANEKGVASPIR